MSPKKKKRGILFFKWFILEHAIGRTWPASKIMVEYAIKTAKKNNIRMDIITQTTKFYDYRT